MKDFFGKDASTLKSKKLWLFDMDGTIYNENTIFPGTLPLLESIKNSGGEFMFITNNSSKSVLDYVGKINNLGINADEDNFFTSTQATVYFLKKKYPNAKVYCQGTKSLIEELAKSGINVTENIDDDVGLVLLGFDTELTSDKLRKTCEILQRELPYYATNPDLVCPVSFGYIPDCGSISQIIYNATKKKPIFLGKPEPTMINLVAQKKNISKEDIIVIGDRLYTDIAAGQNANVDTICVLTGEATLDDIEKSAKKPTFVFKSVSDFVLEPHCKKH